MPSYQIQLTNVCLVRCLLSDCYLVLQKEILLNSVRHVKSPNNENERSPLCTKKNFKDGLLESSAAIWKKNEKHIWILGNKKKRKVLLGHLLSKQWRVTHRNPQWKQAWNSLLLINKTVVSWQCYTQALLAVTCRSLGIFSCLTCWLWSLMTVW